MTGRDLRVFITNHRAEDLEKLTLRMKDGLGSSKYKPVQYEQLQAMVEAKRLSSQQIDQKVQRTLRAAQLTKESTLLRQHRQVWSKEHDRLTRAGERAESELQTFLGQHALEERIDFGLLSEMLDYELLLEREREAFHLATVEPVWQLREDLQYRLAEVRPPAPQHSEWECVLEQVYLVKEQQEAIKERLYSECLSLEREISSTGAEACLAAAPEAVAEQEPVPEEILTSECPYPELRDSLIHEFQTLSEKYRSRLQTAQSRLQAWTGNRAPLYSCPNTHRYCDWSAEDHLRFQATVSQYSPDLRHRRSLYMDMLQRIFPDTSRQELNAHERSWDWYRFSLEQLWVLGQSWQRDRAELLAKALLTLEEARHAHLEQQALQSHHRHQQHICTQLRDKLQQWRAQQEEVASLETAIAARWQEEEEERLKKEQERDLAKRTRQREQVKQFYSEQRRRREEQDRRDQRRLAELRRAMAEQARRDKERVQFREELLWRRREEHEACALLRLQEEDERQERLQALRDQVAVVAEADPERMMGDTKAWRGHQQPEEEGFVPHRPLYHLHTYTDTQILSDPRVRIEQALRTAGLHNTLYAKELLSEVPPPRPPRRDTESTAFKS